MASKAHNRRLRNLAIMRIGAALETLRDTRGIDVPKYDFKDRDLEQREAKTLDTLAGVLEGFAAEVPAEIESTPEQCAADRDFIEALLRDRSKPELAEMVAAHGLDVSTSAKKEELIAALVDYAAGGPVEQPEPEAGG